jgi:hypothetical protein
MVEDLRLLMDAPPDAMAHQVRTHHVAPPANALLNRAADPIERRSGAGHSQRLRERLPRRGYQTKTEGRVPATGTETQASA